MATIEDEVRDSNLQGIELARQGRLDDAAAWFRHALQLKPDSPASNNNLANILSFQGKLGEAEGYYRTAVSLLPDDPATMNNLGNVLRQLGQLDEAVDCGRRALALAPAYAEAHSNLGIALQARGELEEAQDHCRQAIQLQPQFPEAHNNLGMVLRQLGRHDEAADACREALRLRPDFAEAHNNLGMVLAHQQRWDDAVACYHEALRLRPDLVEAKTNLAHVYWRQGRLDESADLCHEVLRLRPDTATAHNVLGTVCLKKGLLDEALDRFDQAIRFKPDLPEAHFNRSQVKLLVGDLEEGFRDYEWRLRCEEFVVRKPQRPAWNGSSLAGKTIVLHTEQGLGDTMQFIRYAPLVKQRGARVIVACPPVLIPLLRRCPGIDDLIPHGEASAQWDEHAPLLSLPHLLGTTLATIPAAVPYLFADEGLVEHWRRELAGFSGCKIGIAWQGSTKHAADRQRSMTLSQFAPLAQVGVHLLSLQKGFGSEQLAAVAGGVFNSDRTVTDLASRLDLTSGAFMDTAAVMKNLDLVISADTAVAHLAGGLGVPVWVALSSVPDWRWLLHRADSPWYPTMRLFRQKEPGNWREVFQRMADALAGLVGKRSRPCSLLIEVAAGELIDKITILQIKRQRLADEGKVRNVVTELELLAAVRDRNIEPSAELAKLTAELMEINVALWEVEDEIRACERRSDFGPRFIELARSVYKNNDRRSILKRQVNELLGSRLIEEKSYA